ncbi:MAG: hypothetical protein MJK10_14315 [Pseudomonadales bacterium]|nr:hypothetical protein [Pseudomonadales bacterium]NRA17056.1 hypothetical protein [Oceanospirillaceae bacterium]
MKRFGGFLIESGQISVRQLAQVLIEQINNTPASVEILYRESQLDAEQVLDILSLQQDEKLDFPSACAKLHYWREDFAFIIRRETIKARPKLGQLMIDKGWIEPQQMMGQLVDFKAHCEQNQWDDALTTPIAAVEPMAKTDTAESLAALPEFEFDPVFSNIAAESVPDYLDLFCEDKKNNMKLTILSLESLADADSSAVFETLDAFFSEYHSLNGAARSVGAALTEKLIHQSEDILAFFKQFSINVNSDDFANLTAINLSVLDLLWGLREQLVECASEEAFWMQSSSREEYMSLLQKMQLMLQQLNGRGYQVALDDISDEF